MPTVDHFNMVQKTQISILWYYISFCYQSMHINYSRRNVWSDWDVLVIFTLELPGNLVSNSQRPEPNGPPLVVQGCQWQHLWQWVFAAKQNSRPLGETRAWRTWQLSFASWDTSYNFLHTYPLSSCMYNTWYVICIYVYASNTLTYRYRIMYFICIQATQLHF